MSVRYYVVPKALSAEMDRRIAAVNARGARLGASPWRVTGREERREAVLDDAGIKIGERTVIRFELTGEPPKVTGWTAVARVTWDRNAGVLVRSFDDRERPRPATAFCEHCHSDRNRNLTYLVADDAGNEKQVGSTCVKDFTGLEPAAIDWYADSDDDFEKEWPDTPYDPGTEILLSLAVASVRQYGWLSAAKARERGGESTARRVMTYLEGHHDASGIPRVSDADRTRAREVRSMILADSSGREYATNLRSVLGPDTVSLELAPLAASAVAMAERIEADRRVAAASTGPAEPLPVGDGLDLEGLVISAAPKESFEGMTWKMTVLGRGWKVYATIPATLLDAVDDPEDLKGHRISVRMNVEASRDDPAFGFGSRPRLGKLLD